jgi:hypothetical protein
MENAVKATRTAMNVAKLSVDRANNYGEEEFAHLENRWKRAKEKYEQALAKLKKLPTPLFLDWPIERDEAPDIHSLLPFLQDLEDRMRNHEIIYMFSGSGAGRVGTIGASILTRIYGVPGHEALERIQRYHDARRSHVDGGVAVSCPQTTGQVSLVKAVASHGDGAYSSITREDDEGFLAIRSHQRGVGVPPLGELISGDRMPRLLTNRNKS